MTQPKISTAVTSHKGLVTDYIRCIHRKSFVIAMVGLVLLVVVKATISDLRLPTKNTIDMTAHQSTSCKKVARASKVPTVMVSEDSCAVKDRMSLWCSLAAIQFPADKEQIVVLYLHVPVLG